MENLRLCLCIFLHCKNLIFKPNVPQNLFKLLCTVRLIWQSQEMKVKFVNFQLFLLLEVLLQVDQLFLGLSDQCMDWRPGIVCYQEQNTEIKVIESFKKVSESENIFHSSQTCIQRDKSSYIVKIYYFQARDKYTVLVPLSCKSWL